MADTPKRLAGPAQLTAASAIQYTVPASTTTIVKQIILHNSDTSGRTVTVGVGVDAAGTRVLNGVIMAAGEILSIDCWLVLGAAETLRAHASVASVVQITVNGVEVT